MLKQTPIGMPVAVPGGRRIMANKYKNQMLAEKVERQVAAYQGKKDAKLSMAWLKECVNQGAIPYELVEDSHEYGKGDWGPPVKVGIPGRTGDFVVMQNDYNTTDDDFWSLPEDIQQAVDRDVTELLMARRNLDGTPNVRYANESPAAARLRQQRAATEAKESNDPVVQNLSYVEEKDAPMATQYGKPFEQCKQGWFAVAHETFQDGAGGSGVSIYQVDEVFDFGKEADLLENANYFTATHMLVPSTRVFAYDPKCLEKTWHKVKMNKTEKVLGWQIVYYFQKLTQGKKIPAHKKILTLAEDHELQIFEQPQQRQFAEVLSEEEADEEADEESEADEEAEEKAEENDEERSEA